MGLAVNSYSNCPLVSFVLIVLFITGYVSRPVFTNTFQFCGGLYSNTSEEDDLPKSVHVRSNKRKFLEYDEDSDIPDDTDVAAPASACFSYKKIKSELPEVVAKKNTEKPLPHPFPFPSNYRPEVEICLKNKRMTKEARKHFHSSVASAMFSYKRSSCYLVYYGQGWGDEHSLSLILCIPLEMSLAIRFSESQEEHAPDPPSFLCCRLSNQNSYSYCISIIIIILTIVI